MAQAKRILQVVHSLGMGGAETWLLQVLKYWRASGNTEFELDFLITGGEESVLDAEFKRLGAEIFYLPLKKGAGMSFIRSFRSLLKTKKYAAIHDHQDFLSGWHFLFGLGLLSPVRVVHVHNPSYQIYANYATSFRRRIQLQIGKKLVRLLATHIGGTSEKILGEYGITKKYFPNQWVHALNCAFSITDWQGDHFSEKAAICKEQQWPLDSKIVLFAGRFDNSLSLTHPQNHKNSTFALLILEACATDPDIKMIMVGANDYIRDEFLELIVEKGLSDKIHLLGIRKDMIKLMSGSDLLLFPSRAEGLGMVAVEAQAAGLHVLASTAVPGECVVLEELVQFCSLTLPVEEWATILKSTISLPRKQLAHADTRWQDSGNTIEVC